MKESTAVTNHANMALQMIAKVQPNLNWRCIHLCRQQVRNGSVHVEIRNDIARNLTSYCSLMKKAGPTSRNIAPWHINIELALYRFQGFLPQPNDNSTFAAQVSLSKRGFWFLCAHYINLVTSTFLLFPVEKPCTSPVLIILRISVQMLEKVQRNLI